MLAGQVREKRMREENDQQTNKNYMNQQLLRTEEENTKVRDAEKQRKQKMFENQQFLLDQMRANPTPSGAAVTAGNAGTEGKQRNKARLGGMMNPEEARMNRALLKEISRIKRGEEPTGLLAL